MMAHNRYLVNNLGYYKCNKLIFNKAFWILDSRNGKCSLWSPDWLFPHRGQHTASKADVLSLGCISWAPDELTQLVKSSKDSAFALGYRKTPWEWWQGANGMWGIHISQSILRMEHWNAEETLWNETQKCFFLEFILFYFLQIDEEVSDI